MSSESGPSKAPPPPPSNSTTEPPSISPSFSTSLSSPSLSSDHHPDSNPNPKEPLSPESLRQLSEARTALLATMTNIGTGYSKELEERARNMHDASKMIERQEKELRANVEKLRKEGGKLERELRTGESRVKGLGNVQNWAEVLERDFLVLKETLRLADEPSESSEWSTDDEGSMDGKHQDDENFDQSHAPDQDIHRNSKVDAEGDTKMGESADMDKGKGREGVPIVPEVSQFIESVGGSCSATTTEVEDPSENSVHTSASIGS